MGLIAFYQQSGPVYDKFLQEWRETPPLEQSAVGPQSPVNVSEACNSACLADPPWGGAYSYDATMLVANAWKRVLEEGGDPRDLQSGALLKAIRSIELPNSLTGNLSLDADGNPKSRKYDVFQLQLEGDLWNTVGTIDDVDGLELYEGGNLRGDSQLNFGLGPGVVPGDGNGPVASETEVVEWLPNDPDKAFFGPGEWLFATRNVYGEWVPVTEEICVELNVTVKDPAGKQIYATTCVVAEPGIVDKLEKKYRDTQLGSSEYDGSGESLLTWEEQYLQFIHKQEQTYDEVGSVVSGTDSKVTLENALCSCPLDIPSLDPSLAPNANIYVKLDKRFIPGMNPYPVFRIAGGAQINNGAMDLLKIVLPVVFGLFLILIVGLSLYIMRQRRKSMFGWVIDKSELEFDDPVKVIGTGGTSDVIEARFRGTPVAVKRTLVARATNAKSQEMTRSGSGHSAKSREAGGPRLSKGEGSMERDKYKDKPLGISSPQSDIEASHPNPAFVDPLQSSGLSTDRSTISMTASMSSGSWRWSQRSGGGWFGFLSCFRKQGSFSKRLSFDSTTSSFNSFVGTTTMSPTRNLVSSINKALFREMRLVTKLRHPNIVQTMGAVVQKGAPPMLVMELMSNGSMFSIVHNDVLPIDLELVASILSDTTKGLRYLHEAKPPLIHGDLKLMNILVDDRLTAKLSDFGLSFMQGKTDIRGGSLLWMAPELLTGQSKATEMSDVYALGVTMYEMFTGFKPYHDIITAGTTAQELIRAITEDNIRPAIPPKNADGTLGRLNLQVPGEFLDLMTECWHKNPLRRPSVKEIETRTLEIIEANQLVRTTNTMGKQQQALLQDILPAKVIKALSEGRKVEPESYDPVTIFFSDIVGFTKISQTLPPEKVMAMLDDMYSRFDQLVKKHGLFKVETIGDAYMAVGGLPEPQPDHTLRVARFALDARASAAEVPIDREAKGKGNVQIRVGFHSGSVVASVVGSVNPRYCLFGDTVNVASRMESHSEAKKINMSPEAHKLLMEQCPEAECVDRGVITVKGKGNMNCWFLKKAGDSSVCYSSMESGGTLDGTLRISQSSRGGGKYG